MEKQWEMMGNDGTLWEINGKPTFEMGHPKSWKILDTLNPGNPGI